LKLVVRPRPEVYAGRVAVLVDGLSLCATEIFAGGLRDLGRAGLFGSPTGGATLGGSVEKLPNGDRFMYAFANYVTAGGHVIEGQGLKPDVDVRPTREALLQGKDPALEAAIAWITTGNVNKQQIE
jgi:carboxyl-terminal processing protease